MSELTYKQHSMRAARKRFEKGQALEFVRAHAQHVPIQDQQLLDAYFRFNFSLYELGRIHKVNSESIRRRIKTILRRINDPFFRATITYAARLPTILGEMAMDRFVHGVPLENVAAKHNLSYSQAARRMVKARYMIIACSLVDPDGDPVAPTIH